MQSTQEDESGRSWRLIVAGAVLLAIGIVSLSLTTGVGLATISDGGDEPYTVDAGHELVEDESISAYESDGSVSGEVDSLDATVSYADNRDAVDVDDFTPVNSLHEFIRIEYHEDISRELRIWIPAEYATPYPRDSVDAVNSDKTASYDSVRGGSYLQVTVEVDGESDIVLPVHRHSSTTYSIIQSYNDRWDSLTGDDREWAYLDAHDLEDEHSVEIDADPDEIVLQYDETPEDPDETWVNLPRDPDGSTSGVYWYSPDSEETVYVVSQGEGVDIRYMAEDGGLRETAEGYANEARQYPDRIRDRLEDGLGGLF